MSTPGWFTFVAAAFAAAVGVVVAGVLLDDMGLVAFGGIGFAVSVVEWFTAIDEANR